MAVTILHDNDADLKYLQGLTVGVIGYGAQGTAQALCMRDSGVNVIIGIRKGPSYDKAKNDGFEVMTVSEAAAKADIIHILLPDETQGGVYANEIKPYIKKGKILSFSHGFNIVYKQIDPPSDVDVIMVAPKAPGTEVRKTYVAGFGVPGLIAVRQNASGKAKDIALAMAKAEGLTKAGVLECTFEQEAYEDLFGEQVVLCGGTVQLIKYGFETLVEAGYPPEMAYFECLHELKLIVDLIYEGGIQKMNEVISNTAEWGEYVVGKRIITEDTKKEMKKVLNEIEDGTFAKNWMAEAKNGCPNLKKNREDLGSHEIEIVGKKIRSLFEKKK
ncbi:MAG: ketol-acid reductoisomerase [Spirochaetes bacterium GWD1_27_9]|nr:MAG: ketol-acid reductoisomerase [Spirochaetes bacterium GWC1_27_15]OHD33663.1 MAG: ketol-acid reductoisomerase [Spirochaetes bacterium GWD1_27_9]